MRSDRYLFAFMSTMAAEKEAQGKGFSGKTSIKQ